MSTGVVDPYLAQIRNRLRSYTCINCGHSLADAVLDSARDGTTLEEYGLSESSVASVLAATEVLSVSCAHCGAASEIGTLLRTFAEARPLTEDDLRPWSPAAVEAYQSGIRARLASRTCASCGSSLDAATVTRAFSGTTLPEHALTGPVAAAVIAWTQSLQAQCPRCFTKVDV